MIYNFKVRHEVQLKERDGRIDFKELDLVQNVEAGQVVARKEPREDGTAGPDRDGAHPAGQDRDGTRSSNAART